MRFFELFKTIPLYINYYLHAVDEHSLQAPFVFEFYTSLKQNLNKARSYSDIERLRHKLLNDLSIIQIEDVGAGSRRNRRTSVKTIRQIAKNEVSHWEKCAFLSALIQAGGFPNCVELGTSLGITTAYLSRTCISGKIFTFEGDIGLCELASSHFKNLACNNVKIIQGNIDDTLTTFLEKSPPIECAIIDANHTSMALERYFLQFMTNFAYGGIIIIDDIRWSTDMYKGWNKLLKHPAVSISLEFRDIGVLIINADKIRQHYVLEFPR